MVWVMQQDNDPLAEKEIIKMLLRTAQSPDLKQIEMLCWNVKRAVHKQMLPNLNEIKQNCTKKWVQNTNILLLDLVLHTIKCWDVLSFSTHCFYILAYFLSSKN